MEERRTRHRYGFSTTGKLHKIYKGQVGTRSNRSTYSQCGMTSLHNYQYGDLVIENHNFCRLCFRTKAKSNPKTLLQKLRSNDSDRLNWIQRMGISI